MNKKRLRMSERRMNEYEKINTLWKRDMEHKGIIIPFDFSKPEFELVNNYEFTEKIDGQCVTVVFSKNDVKIYGKNEKTEFNKAHDQLLSYINNKLSNELCTSVFDLTKADTIILYGEGYGIKIQKGGKYRDDQSFILFDIMIDGIWLESDKVTEYAAALGLERVPIVGHGTWGDAVDFVLKRPDSVIGKAGTKMEGIVCRSNPLVLDRFGRRIIFKLKLEDYDHYDRVRSQMHYDGKKGMMKNGKD
jgi:hypothetical protein